MEEPPSPQAPVAKPTKPYSSSIEEFFEDFELAKSMTDEQLMEKYKDSFKLESEFIAGLRGNKKAKVVLDDAEDDSFLSPQEKELTVQAAVDKIKKKKLEKLTKKQVENNKIKDMLLNDPLLQEALNATGNKG